MKLEEGQEGDAGRPDYTLKCRDTVVIVETKKPGFPLEKATNQVSKYTSHTGAKYVVLTNGSVWNIYDNSKYDKPFKDRMVSSCDLSKQDAIRVCITLITLLRSDS